MFYKGQVSMKGLSSYQCIGFQICQMLSFFQRTLGVFRCHSEGGHEFFKNVIVELEKGANMEFWEIARS
jgi:hypothetical protein